ncbi:MAG: rhodanese-like domain-containing protein [Eubacteriales bacterium]|nr:rhodanese-like domain-containing protein [Eubacteriales bacterium]
MKHQRNNKIRVATAVVAALMAALLAACGASSKPSYRQITADEAARMMQEETDFVLLDVRTQEEYASGHIPGAICIPNETIGSEEIPELPEKDQLILVYCRSGNRSKQASQKLAEQDYTNVVEFGGINGWTGNLEK